MGRANKKVPGRTGRSGFAPVLAEFLRLFRSMSDSYRPELHYMRGPGPKWRAKHAAVTTAEAPAHPAFARISG